VRALALKDLQPDPAGLPGGVLSERSIGVDCALLYAGEPLSGWRDYDLWRELCTMQLVLASGAMDLSAGSQDELVEPLRRESVVPRS
jgi:hypothetical protein